MSWRDRLTIPVLTDSYKPTHAPQYPPKTTKVSSFFESRGGDSPETVFFGLQPILPWFERPITEADVHAAAVLYTGHYGTDRLFNAAGWLRIAKLGYLPLLIRAVPEGSVVPCHNVLMTVENTHEEFAWLTNYVESLAVQVWYPSTVATQSREIKRIIIAALEESGDPSGIDFKLHDFGFRGSTTPESAAIGGCAHLVNFKGTDTVPALLLAQDIYMETMAGFSIPAAEHSTITSWGRAREVDACRNMLERFPTGPVAVVSDSYDVFAACRDIWGGELRDQVLFRDGVLIIRPDSGDPPTVLLMVLEILGERFGYTVNAKGYKVLHPKVRVIQGDGIDKAMVVEIYRVLLNAKWSADNLAFGSGGGLLQKVNRDTHKYAFKCSYVEVDGQPTSYDVMKDPVTDPGKRSKAGRFSLIRGTGTDYPVPAGGYLTIPFDPSLGDQDLLQPVFHNGKILRRQTLADIRQRAALPQVVQA